jgi:hypothetical protein
MNPCFRNLALGTMALAWLTIGSAAQAQSDTAIAEQLFLDGQKLVEAGHYPEACSKFADSERLDPALGTLMHLAACHEKMGKFAAAWGEFTDVAAQARKAGQGEREKYAREHAAALEARLPRIIIELPHPPDGTAIKLDAVSLPLGVLGTEIPIDPGEHALEVVAPRMKPWRQAKLSFAPGSVVTRIQVTLEEDTAPAPPHVAPSPGTGSALTVADSESAAPSGNTTKRILGFGIGGLGVASLAVAVGEEVTSIGRHNDESKYPAERPDLRQQVADQANAAQTYAIVFGAAGVVAIAAGVYLVVTSHDATSTTARSAHVRPALGPGVAGGAIDFTW